MWNPTARVEHSRASLRYGSDLTDAEWQLIEPYLPPPQRRGRRRRWPMRQIVEAIFYVLRSGCPWRLLPDSFPPWRTVYRWFSELRESCVFEGLNHHLHHAAARPLVKLHLQKEKNRDWFRHHFTYIAAVAAVLGFSGIAGALANVAIIIFVLALIAGIVLFIIGKQAAKSLSN